MSFLSSRNVQLLFNTVIFLTLSFLAYMLHYKQHFSVSLQETFLEVRTMTNDKRVIENLRAHYQEIISNYVITAYATSCHGSVSAGMVCTPPLSSLSNIKNIVKNFSNTPCDLYPSIIKYCEAKDIAENELYKKRTSPKQFFQNPQHEGHRLQARQKYDSLLMSGFGTE